MRNYKIYGGNIIEQTLKLVKDDRIPMSFVDIMKMRLEVLKKDEKTKIFWWDNYFDTGDGIFYHPDGEVKIVLNSEFMRGLNSKSLLKDGALLLDKDRNKSIVVYDSFEGVTFTREEIEKYAGKRQTRDEVKANPIWKALAGGDQALLDKYVDAVFAEAKQRYGYDTNMGIWIASPQDVASGRLWFVLGLGGSSYAGGDLGIYYSLGRLPGVVPEAHSNRRGEVR